MPATVQVMTRHNTGNNGMPIYGSPNHNLMEAPLNEQLRLLIELQKLDRRIISHGKTIKAIPQKISSMDAPIQEAEKGVTQAKSRYESLEKNKREKELSVEAIKDKIQKAKARTSDIKDNKAYQAHLKEIENLEKSITDMDDDILALMEQMEPLASELKAADAALAAQKQRAQELRKKLDAEAAEAQKELDSIQAERGQYTDPVDEKNYTLYMDLLTSLGGQAVVDVDDEICGGCFMNIMPQLYVEVQKGQKIIQCPQCRRILYYKHEEES